MYALFSDISCLALANPMVGNDTVTGRSWPFCMIDVILSNDAAIALLDSAPAVNAGYLTWATLGPYVVAVTLSTMSSASALATLNAATVYAMCVGVSVARTLTAPFQ